MRLFSVLIVLAIAVGPAHGQIGPVLTPPASKGPLSSGVSPYINLARGGNPGLNYYGIVRPQLEFRALQNQFLQAGPRAGVPSSYRTGGTRSYFGNYLHYYR